MRLKFWRWAHKSAERLWHWIYYNRLPDGIEAMRKAAEAKNYVYSYSANYVSSNETHGGPGREYSRDLEGESISPVAEGSSARQT